MSVAGLRLTVLSAMLDAQPPATVQLGAGGRLGGVQVLYQGGGAGPAGGSPHDLGVTGGAGAVGGASQGGRSGAPGGGGGGRAGWARRGPPGVCWGSRSRARRTAWCSISTPRPATTPRRSPWADRQSNLSMTDEVG